MNMLDSLIDDDDDYLLHVVAVAAAAVVVVAVVVVVQQPLELRLELLLQQLLVLGPSVEHVDVELP